MSSLVTGGAGFIGSHLVDALLEEGARVTALDNFTSGREENLAHHDGDARLTVVRGSVLDEELVDRLVAQHETVYHLAAVVGVHHVLEDPLGAVLTNVRGTENVLAAAHRRGVRVVLASSSEIYGVGNHVPFREGDHRVIGPTWVHRWSYATSKAIDEHLAFAYADMGLRVSVLRYFNAYGERMDQRGYGSVIARFAHQAIRQEPLTVHGDGKQTRCFTYVSDAVRGTLLAGQRDEALGRAFNIGSDTEVTIWELAHRIREALDSSSPVVLVPYEVAYPRGFEDTRRRVPDVSRARILLGFQAEVDLQRGLDLTLAWCRRHYA